MRPGSLFDAIAERDKYGAARQRLTVCKRDRARRPTHSHSGAGPRVRRILVAEGQGNRWRGTSWLR